MSTDDSRWFHRRGRLTRGDWESVVDDSTPGWEHTGIRVAEIGDGDRLTLDETDVERMFVPLAGSFVVTYADGDAHESVPLEGRASVFAGPTDVLYLTAGATAVIAGTGRIAVATSPTAQRRPTTYIPASATPVELRGAGRSSRQVHNFGTPGALDAARLIVCEVITPAGNWSSYPPHKHDEHIPGHESRLEEIYYFEAASDHHADHDAGAYGVFSASSSPAGEIEIDARVRTGDIALIPYGYHGPAAAAPGYDLYYLNVMAGPDPERTWLISDDPDHAWVRQQWLSQDIDDRLPYGAEQEEGDR